MLFSFDIDLASFGPRMVVGNQVSGYSGRISHASKHWPSHRRLQQEIVDQAPTFGSQQYAPTLLPYWEGQMLQWDLNRLIRKGLIREGKGTYVRTERNGRPPLPVLYLRL